MIKSEIKVFLLLICLSLPSRLCLASACCAGGGPKSFLSLQRLQKHEVGFSSTLEDTYGNFSPFGELHESRQRGAFKMSLGFATRILSTMETSVIVPFVTQFRDDGFTPKSGVGDLLVSGRWWVWENLLNDSLIPSVALTTSLKFPTGETITPLVPGTGNGFWEGSFGVELKKEWAPIFFQLSGSYTAFLNRKNLNKGDYFELSELVGVIWSRRLNTSLGISQTWELMGQQSREVQSFLSLTYFMTQFWSLNGSYQFTVPLESLSVNRDAVRAFSLSARYGFY